MINASILPLLLIFPLIFGVVLSFEPTVGENAKRFGKFLLLLVFSTIIWGSVAYITVIDVVAKETVVLPTKVFNPDGSFTQVIAYKGIDDKPVVGNLNSVFGGVITDDAKVTIREFEWRTKYGLFFSKPPTKYLWVKSGTILVQPLN